MSGITTNPSRKRTLNTSWRIRESSLHVQLYQDPNTFLIKKNHPYLCPIWQGPRIKSILGWRTKTERYVCEQRHIIPHTPLLFCGWKLKITANLNCPGIHRCTPGQFRLAAFLRHLEKPHPIIDQITQKKKNWGPLSANQRGPKQFRPKSIQFEFDQGAVWRVCCGRYKREEIPKNETQRSSNFR
jgi:hypothetical protein